MVRNSGRQERSNDALRRASLAVQYELMSMYAAYDFVEKANVGWMSNDRAKAFSNVCVHSMLLAARSLLAFLYSHNPRDSDIIAEDFFDDPADWRLKRIAPSPEMADGHRSPSQIRPRAGDGTPPHPLRLQRYFKRLPPTENPHWARLDSNQRPDDYESPALTAELRAPTLPGNV